MNGPSGIFATGTFVPAGAGVESSTASAIGSTFRTPWLMEQERSPDLLGPIHAQAVKMAGPVDRKGSSAWDGLSNIYSNKSWSQFS